MENLRITNVEIIDSTNISIRFSNNLTNNLVTSNIEIISEQSNIPNSEVLKLRIKNDVLLITCQPLTPMASYTIILKSTVLNPFQSVNGTARILEDNVSNKYMFTGPLSVDNNVRKYFENYFKDNIYELNESSVISKYIDNLSLSFSKLIYDINQVKNENYLSFNVTDEFKTRGFGPFDRLNEESAYLISRVARTPTNTVTDYKMSVDTFPNFPITLQKESFKESLQVSSLNEIGKFNINSLTFNLSNSPVTKVNKITFTLNSINAIYEYNIETLGYQINNSRYDKDYGFDFKLEENQIKINDKILEDPNFIIDGIIKIDIEYEYKNLGRVVNSESVNVFTRVNVSREVIPSIVNIFNLKHSVIIDQSNNLYKLGGVTFTDPNSNNNSPHPAFIVEIPYRIENLPGLPGQYSIDYSSGTVYVYGQDLTNNGTGPYPPLATYAYKLTYKNQLDYVYDEELLDLVALPNGSLIDFSGIINFQYEQVLIPGIDYVSNLHKEELNERIENKLFALNAFKTKFAPITNVFRIYNETSGEIYALDRWNHDKVYFRYNNPPRLEQKIERVSFNTITNELLFVNSTLTNIFNLKIFKILLNNNTIIASTEDGIGSSINTSVVLANSNIFINERWFNKEFSEFANINKLINVGEYNIDYFNGIIYVAVSNNQDFNIGTVSYKNNAILTELPHIITVNDIYYRISLLDAKDKTFKYLDFTDNTVVVKDLENSDEEFLNKDDSAIYQVYQNSVGSFVNAEFLYGVTNKIQSVNGLYEYNDLLNNLHPINFGLVSDFSNFDIQINTINKQTFENVQFDGSYFISLNENISYLSPNITYTFSVIRLSDNAELWNGSGIVDVNNGLKLILSGVNTPQINDLVRVTYSFAINDLSRIVVDYNKGNLYIDYTYLADEIIVSYEYGDNNIDFRTSKTVSANDSYYVSYKVGALRDSLLKNFGSLVNIDELSNFDINYDRERYRDALSAALSSFIQGPTVAAMKNIGKTISHIEPEVTESIFQGWSLGNSLLYPQDIITEGDFALMPAKFGNGVLLDKNQTVKFPANSNLRLEEGTFENWIIPQWNGLDNDADITFSILKDGYAISQYEVFIGAGEYHPEILNNKFTLNKNSINIFGTPNKNKDGIFIYYNKDTVNNYNRWYVDIVDGYVNSDGYNANYKFTIETNGKFYNSKVVSGNGSSLTTSNNKLIANVSGVIQLNESFSFLADLEHYILDLGNEKANRLSLYKDVNGTLVFRVYDKFSNVYSISHDVSGWSINEQHHVAISWKLNTANSKDEMHLFVDGFEIPNIMSHKNRNYLLTDRFEDITDLDIIGVSNKDIVGSNDLVTVAGSQSVSSSINFSSFDINIGDTININEVGFGSFTIISVNGQNLTLNNAMPMSISNGNFSINSQSIVLDIPIDLYKNIAVARLESIISGNDLIATNSNIVNSVTTNFTTQNIELGYFIRINDINYSITNVNNNSLTLDKVVPTGTGLSFIVYNNEEVELAGTRAIRPDYTLENQTITLLNNTFENDLIVLKTFGLSFMDVKAKYYVWGNTENVLMTRLPPPVSLDEVEIKKVIVNTVSVNPSNSTIVLSAFNFNPTFSQPSVSVEGRQFDILIKGNNNVDFTTPTTVQINGVINGANSSETVSFTSFGNKSTLNNFTSISSINVKSKPINLSKPAITVEIKELYSIHNNTDGYVDGYTQPEIRYSYHMGGGYKLKYVNSNTVKDDTKKFSSLHVNNYLVIYTTAAAGFYLITGISEDRHSLNVVPTNPGNPLVNFTDATYQLLNTTTSRSGLQNGFFTFEQLTSPGVPYNLTSGFYSIEYNSNASIKLDPLSSYVYLGTDINNTKTVNSILDQVKIYSVMLTDTRVGETIPNTQNSITKDFNSLKPLKAKSDTLMLINFDTFPFINSAKIYRNIVNKDIKKHFQSSVVVNDNFNTASLVLLNKPLIVDNLGILDTKKSGTIEFWMNPLYDTYNDPNQRYYFDAFGAITEEYVSFDNTSVMLKSPASQILSVKMQNKDYFAGGKLEISTENVLQEVGVSSNANTTTTSKQILQVISVKIEDDFRNIDYFSNGTIGTDLKTIYLGKTLPQNNVSLIVTYKTFEFGNKQNTQVIRLNNKLPYQNSKVQVTYIPKGLIGDRMSIFKDEHGYMNFAINNSVVRAPVLWSKDTWHRVKASYKINSSSGVGNDEMRLFLDGYEFRNLTFGEDVFSPLPYVFGSSSPGDGYNYIKTIPFKDNINQFYIGTDYNHNNPVYSLIDNFRISDISRPIFAPYGESLDVNYSNNLETVFPVTEDLYTTYLFNFDKTNQITNDFAILRNKITGLFDFSINILDSLGIINNNAKVKEVLEKLIKVLKPANSKVKITYQD